MKINFYFLTFFTLLFIFNSCEKEDDNETIKGCTDSLACNYNENAADDDGSCEYAVEGYDCDGNFLGQTHMVFAGNFYYDPSNFTINIGDQVVWINDGGLHDVNGEINSITNTPFENPESFNSPSTSEIGAVIFSHIFTIPGVYNYDCSVGGHALNGMVGTITVLD
tara:strand:+ start:202 stop:699 length:498 start_codon:yes stop_codon:yes gene_type:complete